MRSAPRRLHPTLALQLKRSGDGYHPYIETCIAAFGVNCGMFESDFRGEFEPTDFVERTQTACGRIFAIREGGAVQRHSEARLPPGLSSQAARPSCDRLGCAQAVAENDRSGHHASLDPRAEQRSILIWHIRISYSR